MTGPDPSWRKSFTARLSSGGRLPIGAFVVDPAANELHRDGRTIRLRPLLMDVLLRLAAADGQVVSREQLIDDVWTRRMVNDEVLSRAIAELRTALDDDARQPRYIETLPKVGYRLVAEIGAVMETARVAEVAHVTGVADVSGVADVAEIPAVAIAGDGPPYDPTSTTVPTPPAPPRIRWRVIAGLALLAAAIVAILFSRDKSSSVEALTVQLAAAQSFAADDDLELAPRFSPDGSMVIYAKGTARETKLVIRDLRGNIVSTIEKPGALLLSPVFGPWSRKVYFWQRTSAGCAIIERDVSTAVERQVIGCEGEPQPRFDVSWDGAFIAVSLRPRPQHPVGIAKVRIVDGKLEMLTTPQPGDGDDGFPRFSPDGSLLVFGRGSTSHAKLMILEVAKPSTARPLVAVEGLLYGVTWIGKNGPVIAAADWPGFRALHRVDITTGIPELLGARGARFPDTGPSGDLVFESATYRADLWLADAADPSKSPTIAWPSSRYTNQPEFSPDGTQVVFVSNREGAEALYVASVASIGGEAKRLVHSTEHRYIRAHWTPDGKSLHAVLSPVSARQSGPREGVRIDATTGRIETLSQLGAEVNDVRELGDGSLLVAESIGNAMRLVRYQDGVATRLALPSITQLQVHGDDLVFTQPELTTLTRCSLSSMQCAPLPVEIAEDDLYHWHLGKGVLWYRARPGGGAAKLMKLDLASGATSAYDFAPTGTGTGLASTDDGKWLLVTREAATVIDLMLARK